MTASSREPGVGVGGDASDGKREPIAVFHIDGVTEGWIEKPDIRVSDVLRDADHMTVETDAPDGGVRQALELDLDDVVAIVPAPREPSQARISRRQYAVEVDAGPYRVHGCVHLPIGADPDRYVASTGRRWLPLTACRVTVAEDEFAADVVIVNLDHARRTKADDDEPPIAVAMEEVAPVEPAV